MLDARPFLQLRTASGALVKCGRVEVRPLSLGITGQTGGVAQDQPTHRVKVYAALSTMPGDLMENAVVWIDEQPGQWRAFRVLRNGVERGAGVWTLHLRGDDSATAPPVIIQPQLPPAVGYEP